MNKYQTALDILDCHVNSTDVECHHCEKQENCSSALAIIELQELIDKEEKHRWHDLRKDSNDLPKENGLYLVILLPPNKEFISRKIELIVYSDLMGICKEKHWNNGRVGSDDYENYDERVIAWKYIDIGVIFEDE